MNPARKRSHSLADEELSGNHHGVQSDAGCFSSLFCGDRSTMGARAKKPTSNADLLSAKEMNELSLDEREHVYEDIHGIPRVVEEEPGFIAQKLEALEEELAKIPKKPAYDRALFLSPRYVKRHSFRLMFLRAENFHTEKAALRVVKYFERKLELFGEEKLVKAIDQDDLNEDDQAVLSSGVMHFLRSKDRSGRPVLIYIQKMRLEQAYIHKLRLFWYVAMSKLTEDEDAQKNGVVAVVYNVGPVRLDDMEFLLMRHSARYFDCLPIRFVGFHYCLSDQRLIPALSVAKLVVGTSSRLRFRVHYGSDIECKYELNSFGIPKDIIPVDDEGTLQLSDFSEYLENRRVQAGEATSLSANAGNETIAYPAKNDILLGRGRPYHVYGGNVRFASIIDMNQSRYEFAVKGQKWVISSQVVQTINDSGARFLKRASDGEAWLEVCSDVAREKVSQTFRTKSRRNSAELSFK